MNIALIGMMGSGKSTIGKLLADKLNIKFFDTDEEIVKITNLSINKIFETQGEETFREIETKVLKKILDNDNQVIATGGGIIKKDENRKLLEKATTIYLQTDDNSLFERVKNDNTRPLLNTSNLLNTIKTILSERKTFYEEANIVIDTTNKEPNEIITEIIGKLN